MNNVKEFDRLNIANYIDNAFGITGTGYTIKEKATLLISSDIINILEQIKKDAWNTAIKWAAENAKITNISTQHITGCITTQYTIDEQSILSGLIED